jgi:ribosomal protein L24E
MRYCFFCGKEIKKGDHWIIIDDYENGVTYRFCGIKCRNDYNNEYDKLNEYYNHREKNTALNEE